MRPEHDFKGPSIKDVCTRGGRGVNQKRTHADAGGGGSVAKCGRPQNSNFYQNFRSLFSVLSANSRGSKSHRFTKVLKICLTRRAASRGGRPGGLPLRGSRA